jgi:hypothetical protein
VSQAVRVSRLRSSRRSMTVHRQFHLLAIQGGPRIPRDSRANYFNNLILDS